jgi:hypothetical protein
MSNGQILIKLLRLADEECIDLRTVNKYPNKNIFETKQNLIQALTSAKGLIKLVGINDNAFTEKNPYLILSVLTQLMRVISVKSIDLRNCEELYRLLLPGESIEDLMKLKPEDILIRWVNYHLEKAGQEKRIKNLGNDIADGTAMTYVLNQLDKDCTLAPLSGADNIEKASLMVAESKKIGVQDVASGKDIAKGNPKVNTIFVAEVFNTRHGLEELNQEEKEEVAKFCCDYDDIEGSREERAYRLWVNSLGIDGVFVNNLYEEARDGDILCKVCDRIKPGSVDWSKYCKKTKLNHFEQTQNCEVAFEACKKVGAKTIGLGAQDILEGNKKNMLAIIWQLVRVHYLQLLGSKTEKDILNWANGQVKSQGGNEVTGYRDAGLASGRYLIQLCASFDADIVDWEYVKPGENDEEKEGNAKYAISLARKFGAVIFMVWDDVVKVNGKMMLIFMSSLYDIYLQKEQ